MNKEWTTQQEADALAERFVKLKESGTGQAKFARDHGIPGGASMLSQHIKGRRPLTLEAAVIYAKGFEVPLQDISPRLARQMRAAMETQQANAYADVANRLLPPRSQAPARPTPPSGPVDDDSAVIANFAENFAKLSPARQTAVLALMSEYGKNPGDSDLKREIANIMRSQKDGA